MGYQDDMSVMFDSLGDLTIQQRDTIKSRYRFLMAEYRRRCRLYAFLFYALRLTMTVGSLAVPALLSLKVSPDGESLLYWFTWGISLAVTTSNGITTLFKMERRYFMLHAIAERLRSETWQFLELSGRYSGHYGGHRPSHRNQYVYYCSQLEKIRMKHIDEEFIRQADMGDKNKPVQPQAQEETVAAGGDPNVQLASAVPTPPDQNRLMMSPSQAVRRQSPSRRHAPSPQSRRDSESTVGTNASINGAKEETAMSVPGRQEPTVSETGDIRVAVLSDAPKL